MHHPSTAAIAPSVAQALAFTQDNTYNKSTDHRYDSDQDVQFHDALKESYRQEEARAREAQESYLKDADKKETLKAEEKKAAAAKEAEKNKFSSNEDVEKYDSSQDDIDTAAEENSLDKNVVIAHDPLQHTHITQDATSSTHSADTGSAGQTNILHIQAEEFNTAEALENLEFLSVLNSLQIEDINAVDAQNTSLSALGRIEEFIGKLVQQYAQNDPSATLSNLTPQQVTHIRNQLAQLSNRSSGDDVLNSILALQNIDADTGLSRGGPNGIHAGLNRQDIINTALSTPVMNQISDILANMAHIVKPAPVGGNSLGAEKATALQQKASHHPTTAAEQQLAARLNNSSTAHSGPIGTGIGEQSADLLGLDGEMSDADFERLLNKFTSENPGYTKAEPTRAQILRDANAVASPSPTATPQSTATLPSSFTDIGAGNAPLSVADSILQELGLTGTLVNGSATQTSGLTNIVTNAQNASAPHPAAQTIAAQLHKTANGGINKAITIRLDPPELGRVEIKMSFEANSQIKAVLTVENSETHLMMQRDQQILERALQNAGFDTEGALQFELAQDGHNFDQDGSHDSFHQGQNGEQVPEEEVDVIDTVMNWSENLETGHISYDLLV